MAIDTHDDVENNEMRKVSRRSFLGKVAGGVALGAFALVGGATEAEAQRCTDRDPYDPVGRGRWCRRRRTGITDRDTGRYADPIGRGRGRRRRTGITDRDTGRYADPIGRGRGRRRYRSGITDRDSGRYADPVGNGRGRRRRWRSGCTDRDGGRYADPVRNGRRCRRR